MTPDKNPLKKPTPRAAAPEPTVEERREWLDLKAAAEAKRAAPEPAVVARAVVPDDYDPNSYQGKEPTGEMGRFWFATADGAGWVDEFGQRWPASNPPADAVSP